MAPAAETPMTCPIARKRYAAEMARDISSDWQRQLERIDYDVMTDRNGRDECG